MEALTKEACKVANRVAIGMGLADSSGQPQQIGEIVRDGIAETARLLDRLDPVFLREGYTNLENIFAANQFGLTSDDAWKRFVATQCDALHDMGLHQKRIAALGSTLDVWDKQPVQFQELGDALDRLATVLTGQQELLVRAIDLQAGHDATSIRRSHLFSNAVAGLAIILAKISEAHDEQAANQFEAAAMANFGSRLVSDSVRKLNTVCKEIESI